MNENDLRVVKTKANIRNAFLNLLKTKKINTIKVKEICDLAHCSRNTFYLHYQYKDALLHAIMDECISHIIDQFNPLIVHPDEMSKEIIEKYINSFLSGIKAYEEEIHVFASCELEEIFTDKLSSSLCDKLFESSRQIGGRKADTEEYGLICRYSAYGYISFAMHWINRTSLCFENAAAILYNLSKSSMIYGSAYLSTTSKRGNI